MTMTADPAVVLNTESRLASYFPLSPLSWQDAGQAVFSARTSVVGEDDASSPSTNILLPLGCGPVALTRFDAFPRDPCHA